MSSDVLQDHSLSDDPKRWFVLTFPCTEETLKSAFRVAAKKMHPDIGGDPKQFVQLLADYHRLLSNPATFSEVSQLHRTTDGSLLCNLGLGLGPMQNGKPCTTM